MLHFDLTTALPAHDMVVLDAGDLIGQVAVGSIRRTHQAIIRQNQRAVNGWLSGRVIPWQPFCTQWQAKDVASWRRTYRIAISGWSSGNPGAGWAA
jgi:hypothetical protein